MPRSTTEMKTDLDKGFVSKRKLMNMKTRGKHTSASELRAVRFELTSKASAGWLASNLCCAERQYNSYNILAGSRRPLCNVRGVLDSSTADGCRICRMKFNQKLIYCKKFFFAAMLITFDPRRVISPHFGIFLRYCSTGTYTRKKSILTRIEKFDFFLNLM